MVAEEPDMAIMAYDNMDQFFDKDKILMTGNPVRSEILQIWPKREWKPFNIMA
ncbi:MAG: hypothetical protein R2778_01280 [Saprospiraceae bacterium]